jgi:hypothetical protein
MWLGMQSGSLGKWDRKKNKFVFYNNILPPNNNQKSPVSDILICSGGGIWAATLGSGFYLLILIRKELQKTAEIKGLLIRKGIKFCGRLNTFKPCLVITSSCM